MRYLTRLLAGVVLLFTGCQPRQGQPDGSGTIECTQVQVAPQVAGRLLRLPPQEGAVLKKGDLVAQIDPADYVLKRDEAKALLAQAEAQVALMRAGARKEEIARAREQVREAKVAADAAGADVKRLRPVFEKKSVTQKQWDDARAQADRTAATQAAAEENLARLVAGNRLEEIRVSETQVAVAQARLAQLEKSIADCTVSAPMDGVVTTRSREEGEVVNAGTTLLTLSKLDSVWLSVYVPETRLVRVKLGQTARVKVDGLEKTFEGTVTFISPEAEFTPKNVQTPEQRAKLVYRLKITLPNREGLFKPGLPADAYLEPGTGETPAAQRGESRRGDAETRRHGEGRGEGNGARATVGVRPNSALDRMGSRGSAVPIRTSSATEGARLA